MTQAGEIDVIQPWIFQARTGPGGVERTSRGWLARDRSWDAFHSVTWETPPSRAPWRILPHGPLRLLVGPGDALERILFDDEPRTLELSFGSTLVDWSGQEGEAVRLQEARLLLSGRELTGLVLDLVRSREAQEPPLGDWAFVVSGDSLQLVVESPGAETTRESPSPAPGDSAFFRAWARVDFLDTQWPDVALTVTESRAYEDARRDVPVAWSLSSGDGELEGRLQVASAWLETREGEGPILPVEALFEVGGDVRIQGRSYPVRGVFRHSRP